MTTNQPQAGGDAPITNFSNCHVGIIKGMNALGELPGLLEPAERARRIAESVVALFHDAVLEHHSEEEEALFPAVLASAQPGEEAENVKRQIERLTREHREVEAMWKKLEPALKKVAKGHDAQLDVAAVDKLVALYSAHAAYEEAEFLPLSEKILGRNANHMSALGLTLHMRHTDVMGTYI